MGDPLGARSRVPALGDRPGTCLQTRGRAAAAGRLAALAGRGDGARRGVVLVLVRLRRARSLFRKGADFTAAIAFELASTNLVVELGIVMALILGWQFTVGEFAGGPLMIVVLALLFRAFLSQRLVDEARAEAERGRLGSMEGHAAMDMSVGGEGSLWWRLRSPQGFTATSHIYVMEWAAILRDVVAGLLIASALAAWVPDSWWRSLFLTGHPGLAHVWGPVVGPLVAVLSFVCSIGNVQTKLSTATSGP